MLAMLSICNSPERTKVVPPSKHGTPKTYTIPVELAVCVAKLVATRSE